MGRLRDLRVGMKASKWGVSSVWVFEVGVLEECSGLIMGRRCYKTNQRVSQPDILTFLCRKDEKWPVTFVLSIGLLTSSLSLFGYGNGDIVLWFVSLTVACPWTSIGCSILYSIKGLLLTLQYNLVACRYINAAIWEPLLAGTAFNFCFFFGSLAMAAFSTCSRHSES